MLVKLVEAVFTPKYPRNYRGRHRAPLRLVTGVPIVAGEPVEVESDAGADAMVDPEEPIEPAEPAAA
jgi:hypothetical protein